MIFAPARHQSQLNLDENETLREIEVDVIDLSRNISQLVATKQYQDGFFYAPPDPVRSMRHYTAKDIRATIPHFNQDLLLVRYASASDDFFVSTPGHNGNHPECEQGCLKIESIMQTIFYTFRNQYPNRFQLGGPDLLFLLSSSESPRLSSECLARPGGCRRRKAFAPILHFGAGFSDNTILPSLITMPPALNMHLNCMSYWHINHDICECWQPKRFMEDGSETDGLVFGEHIGYNTHRATRLGEKVDGLSWEDLIPQVVWRGVDAAYLPLLNPEMRPPDYDTDVKPKLNRGLGGILQALSDVYKELRPRWKAVLITAQAEFEANTKNSNPNRKKKILPFANMKFTRNDNDPEPQVYKEFNDLGIPVIGEQLSLLEIATYKYHIDLGGIAGTSPDGTIQKLAMPGVLFHHATAAKDWYHEHLVAWVHYVPVKEDLSDLQEKYEWAELHDRKARSIAKASTEFARRLSRPEGADEMVRRHFLKPLEDVMQAYEPMKIPSMHVFTGADGLVFRDVMRCNGHNVDDCRLNI